MKKSVYKYGIVTLLKPTTVYCAIVIFATAFIYILNLIGDVNMNISGSEFSTFIFLFVVALADFRENFDMLTQNNISRKNIFLSKVLSYSTLAAALALFDRLMVAITTLLNRYNKTIYFGSILDNMYDFSKWNIVLEQIQKYLLLFIAYIAVMSFGTLLSVLFYKANNVGKVLIAAGVPISIFIVLPTIAAAFIGSTLGKFIGETLIFLFSTPLHTILAGLTSAIVLGFIDWLIIRKTTVKSK